MSVEQNQVRLQDGGLTAVGYQWRQPMSDRDEFWAGMLAAGGFALIVNVPCFVWNWKQPDIFIRNFWYYFFELGLPLNVLWLALCCIPLILGWLTESYGVLFGTNDQIFVPIHRGYNRSGPIEQWGYLPQRVSQIQSIALTSVRTNGGGHFKYGGDDGYLAYHVNIYLTSGERLYVGRYLSDATANIVVAQLNLALREIRSMGRLAA